MKFIFLGQIYRYGHEKADISGFTMMFYNINRVLIKLNLIIYIIQFFRKNNLLKNINKT